MQHFQIIFLTKANEFIAALDSKSAKKLLYNIDRAAEINDPGLFKKLYDEIWEFRLSYGNNQIRLLAFWDKTNNQETLVIATHGFIKKTDKLSGNEIERAKNIRKKYFDEKK